jgi:peptide/nickel transport system substrate-binding protein
MENRFGFKDFVLATLVVLLIVVVCLGMVQLDRQWAALKTISSKADEQTRLLASIDRTLNEGITVSSGGSNGSPTSTTGPSTRSSASRYPQGDPFASMKEAEKNPDFARGDWLIDNTGAKIKSITYPIADDLYSQWIQARVTEGLIYRDPMTLEYRPQLATRWEVSEDGMTYTFHLRKGVLFSDGVPFIADDVVFSFEYLMNPKVNCPRLRAYLDNIKSVVKKGDDQVVFTMAKSYFDSLDLCGALTIIPKHLYEKFTEEQVNNNPGFLMGTGPYRMAEPTTWQPGKKLELLRNDLYWGVAPTFDRCIFLEVEEEAAEETMFGNGELDVFATQPEQYERLLKDPKIIANANHYEYASPMNGYQYIAWNEKLKGEPTLFTSATVRRAMTMIIDRQRICKDVFLGYATPISGPFANNSPQADPNIKPWPFDIDQAKRLLAQAGYEVRDNSGVLKDSQGRQFQFKLTYPSGNATYQRVVLFLKDSFARAGVNMELDPCDWPLVQKKLKERDFDAITLGWGGTIESDLYQEFDSSQMQDQGDDFMSYNNPKLDQVVEKARDTVDAAKRMELWHQAHAILHEDQPYTFLFSRKSLRFMAKRIENVKESKIGLNFIYVYSMPCPWYVPKSMQKYKSE